jgi:hypothetical protein
MLHPHIRRLRGRGLGGNYGIASRECVFIRELVYIHFFSPLVDRIFLTMYLLVNIYFCTGCKQAISSASRKLPYEALLQTEAFG